MITTKGSNSLYLFISVPLLRTIAALQHLFIMECGVVHMF